MKEFKGTRTQGPWKWHKRKYSSTYFLANVNETDDDYKVIDDGSAYGEYGASIDVDGADACLIAAAPDLLEALQEILEIGDVYHSAIESNHPLHDFDSWKIKAQSAINKALGE